MRALLVLCALLAALPARAQDSLDLPPRLLLDTAHLQPGNAFRIAVVIEVPAPWHINAHRLSDPLLIPTTVTLTAPAGVALDPVQYPAGETVKPTWSEQPVALYQGRQVFWAAGRVAANAPRGKAMFSGNLRYQACNDQSCFAPQTIPVMLAATISDEPAQPQHADVFGALPASASDNEVARLIGRYGWWPALLFIFLAGLGLNLTPCVYPMITITVSYFGGTASQRSMGRAFASALVYCAGIVVTYSALGLVAALTGSLFGALLQNPLVLVAVAVLLVALALSLFGLYEIQPPRFLLERATGLSGKAGFVGVFFLGAMIGIIAAPCLAPFVVALLTFVAQRADPWLGWWLFFVFACGLGLPYVVLGTFSGLLSRLPKSGMWMVWVKRVFGVGLLVVAGWITSPLWSRQEPLDPDRVAEQIAAARAEKKVVLLDFYATWCGPCQQMDRQTFPDPRVQERLAKLAFIKVNLSRSASPAVVEITRQYKIQGVPTYLFLDPTGREREDLRQVGFVPADDFVKVLDAALAP